MNILIIAFCLSSSDGIKCVSYIPPEFFPTIAACVEKKPLALSAAHGVAKDRNMALVWAQAACVNVGEGA